MKELNREFEYKGYKFNTQIQLVDDYPETIIVNCMGGSNYYQKYSTLAPMAYIESEIDRVENLAKSWADEKKNQEDEWHITYLKNLGFK